jgi:trehalose/maltose transport system substrate-binding protein
LTNGSHEIDISVTWSTLRGWCRIDSIASVVKWDGPHRDSTAKFKMDALALKVACSTSGILFFAIFLGSCGQRAREPVTLNYPHGWWSEPDEMAKNAALARQFTQETGIRIRDIPTPDNTVEDLDLLLNLLKLGSSGADIVHVDLIYSAVIGPDLIDLQPYSATVISSLESQLLRIYTVGGKIIAIPYQVNVGALEYRTDLLREYGYSGPPKTWDELESMAERIQAGERAKGRKDFWGYVWQGADTESLTCNALEWQVAEGGGRIIESDRTISINNPAATRAWRRASHWIGRISPPSVVAYQERDSSNVFDSGRAAFNRVWLGRGISRSEATRQIYWRPSRPVVKTGFASLPGGSAGSASTLGGFGMAVSAHSIHRQEAVKYLLFLVRAQIQSPETSRPSGDQSKVYNGPSASILYGQFEQVTQGGSTLVSRPAIETGRDYRKVSAAYAVAVHSVLTGQKSARDAAAELEGQLIKMTGFHARRLNEGPNGALLRNGPE